MKESRCMHGMIYADLCCSLCKVLKGDKNMEKILKSFEYRRPRPKIMPKKEETVKIKKKVST